MHAFWEFFSVLCVSLCVFPAGAQTGDPALFPAPFLSCGDGVLFPLRVGASTPVALWSQSASNEADIESAAAFISGKGVSAPPAHPKTGGLKLQTAKIVHQKRIDRIVLGFCTKGNLADGIAIPLLPFIQADPKGILKQDGDLRTAAFHKKVLLFRYMQATKGGRFLTAFMLLPGYQPGLVFHLADSVFAAAAFCTAVCLYMVLFRKRNYAIFFGS